MVEYLPILVMFAIAIAMAVVILVLTHLLGPRQDDPVKLSMYESGVNPAQDSKVRFSVKFYLVAILFVLFDIEVVFLYPWAVTYKTLLSSLGWLMFWQMFIFVAVLLVGFGYVWKKGGLQWD
ncbi:MAG: NADH-quinone oxidoreductase subunit A [Gemmatimonadetes bacterium]|nr:MAG: NADH-quinone oxidoreductase subunit A [Gemmatimonadota bacterium]